MSYHAPFDRGCESSFISSSGKRRARTFGSMGCEARYLSSTSACPARTEPLMEGVSGTADGLPPLASAIRNPNLTIPQPIPAPQPQQQARPVPALPIPRENHPGLSRTGAPDPFGQGPVAALAV